MPELTDWELEQLELEMAEACEPPDLGREPLWVLDAEWDQ